MIQVIERAYRYRLYPTENQAKLLGQTFGSCRWVYNYFLLVKKNSWEEKKKGVGYVECSKILTSLKKQYDLLTT